MGVCVSVCVYAHICACLCEQGLDRCGGLHISHARLALQPQTEREVEMKGREEKYKWRGYRKTKKRKKAQSRRKDVMSVSVPVAHQANSSR